MFSRASGLNWLAPSPMASAISRPRRSSFGLIAVSFGKRESVSEGRLQLQLPCAAPARNRQALSARTLSHRHTSSSRLSSTKRLAQAAASGTRSPSASSLTKAHLARHARRRRSARAREREAWSPLQNLPPSSPARAGHSGYAGARPRSLHRCRRAFASHGATWWCQEADDADFTRPLAAPQSATFWQRVAPINPQCPRPRPWSPPARSEDGKATESDPLALADQTIAQSSVAPRVCWRGGAVRRPRHSSFSRPSSSVTISRNPVCRPHRAASSIASAMPSSLLRIFRRETRRLRRKSPRDAPPQRLVL